MTLIKHSIARWLSRHPERHRYLPASLGTMAGYLKYFSDSTLSGPSVELGLLESLLASQRVGESLIDLAVGAPDFGPEWRARFLEAKVSLLPEFQTLDYPPSGGFPALCQAVAQKLHHENRLSFNPTSEILITNGATQAIDLILNAYISPGDKVVLFDPSFMMYGFNVALHRGRIAWVPLTFQDDGHMSFAESALEQAMRGARLIFVNTPSNPTGCVFAKHDLETIARLAAKHDVLIASDEVYEHFQYRGEFISLATMRDARGRCLTINSTSKAYGFAGHRVGYCAATQELIRPLRMQMVPRVPFVATLSQALAWQVLTHTPVDHQALRQNFRKRHERVARFLTEHGIKFYGAAGALYFWLPVNHLGLTGRVFCERLMQAKSVFMMPGEVFGPSGKDHVRLAYACPEAMLEQGLTKLAGFYQSLK